MLQTMPNHIVHIIAFMICCRLFSIEIFHETKATFFNCHFTKGKLIYYFSIDNINTSLSVVNSNMTITINPAIKVINLQKKFGNIKAVDDVSFEIEEGSIVGILGPNGAGKTTTIRLITGIFQLGSSSQVQIFSNDLTNSPKLLKKKFGIVPEISNAYSDLTVWQNLRFSGTIYGLSNKEITTRAEILLKRFELQDKTHAKTKTLSKGLKQRLNLCLALLHEPPILILDEPMTGLDPFSVNIVRNQILEFKRENKTILITTHNMQEAERVCDRILIMNKGKIIADETPELLLKKIKPASTMVFTLKNDLSYEQNTELNSLFPLMEQKAYQISIVSNTPFKDIMKLGDFLEKNKLSILDFKLQESTLEEVFIHLIKNDIKGGINNVQA
ncbi:MAG: ABC transporter ATP-binding protein [Promethearchaeota archaeon]|nr:MAG: ABC transporter ATP-binding protein [Candidatus Lokiarchaeota archaeon]